MFASSNRTRSSFSPPEVPRGARAIARGNRSGHQHAASFVARLLVTLAATLVLIVAAARADPPRYTALDIGAYGTDVNGNSYPYAINASGQVIGRASVYDASRNRGAWR